MRQGICGLQSFFHFLKGGRVFVVCNCFSFLNYCKKNSHLCYPFGAISRLTFLTIYDNFHWVRAQRNNFNVSVADLGGKGVDAFSHQRFEPLPTQRVPPMYYFEISIFG